MVLISQQEIEKRRLWARAKLVLLQNLKKDKVPCALQGAPLVPQS